MSSLLNKVGPGMGAQTQLVNQILISSIGGGAGINDHYE